MRHLNQHGVESFLASDLYGKYAACVLDELRSVGAEPVEPVEADMQVETIDASVTALEPLNASSDVQPGPAPETSFVVTPGAVQDSGEEPA